MKLGALLLIPGLLVLSACSQTTTSDVVTTTQIEDTLATEQSDEITGQDSSTDSFSSVEISFDFTRQTTQATNQMAIWVEDLDGNLIKTIHATRFTTQGGYTRREDSLSHWTKVFDIENKDQTEIDAVSGATPTDGKSEFYWDGTDQDGNKVPSGQYVVKLEGTLYWSSNVVFEGNVDTGKSEGEITVIATYSETDDTNKDMIQNVEMKYVE